MKGNSVEKLTKGHFSLTFGMSPLISENIGNHSSLLQPAEAILNLIGLSGTVED